MEYKKNNCFLLTTPILFTFLFKFQIYQNFSSFSLSFQSSFQLSFTVLLYYRSLIQYLEFAIVYLPF